MALPCTEGATGDDLVMSDFTSPFSLSHREIPLNPHIPFIPGFFFFCAPEIPEREKMNKALCSSHVRPLQERGEALRGFLISAQILPELLEEFR